MDARRRRQGFTLLEMLAVIFLVSVLLFVAIDFYLDLSRASNAAVEQTRDARRAVVLLDRVAHDLEGAVLLVRPPDVADPMAWPWLFLAESRDPDAGADRVKFVRRGRDARGTTGAVSDLEMVAWVAEATDAGDVELRRWSAPQLPESLDRTFPDAGQSDLVTSGLASFGIRFQGAEGAWTGRWDSSTLVGSNELPIAAEIEVAFATGIDGEAGETYTREVLLPLRPLDLAAQLAEAAGQAPPEEVGDEDGDGDVDEDDVAIAEERREESGGEDEDEECVTVAQCLAENPQLQGMLGMAGGQMEAVIQGSLGQCARQFEPMIGQFIPGGFPASCR